MALRSEVEALKTASASTPDGMRTTTKNIDMNAELTVYATYIEGDYFIALEPRSADEMIFSVSQEHATASSDVIIAEAVPRMKNGQSGIYLSVRINYQRQQEYLEQYEQGDTITKAISFRITASDDFDYTIEEDN